MLPLIAGAALTAAPKLILGAYQTYQANKALKDLSKEKYPEYQISPELQGAYSRAQGMSNMGYTPEEQANFQQQMGRQQAGAFRNATDMGGGNLARAISTGLQSQSLGAINQFAAQGAQLKRQNIRYADDLAKALQSQKNMAVSSKIQRRQQLEQAYGGALQSGLSNIAGSVSGVGSMLLQNSLGGGGARTGNPNTPQPAPTPEPDLNSAEIAPENVPSDEQLRQEYPELYNK